MEKIEKFFELYSLDEQMLNNLKFNLTVKSSKTSKKNRHDKILPSWNMRRVMVNKFCLQSVMTWTKLNF